MVMGGYTTGRYNTTMTCLAAPPPSPSLTRTPSPSPSSLSLVCGQRLTGYTEGVPDEVATVAFVLSSPEQVMIESCASDYDTFLAIEDSDGYRLAECDDCLSEEVCNVPSKTVLIQTLPVGSYKLLVGGYGGSTGRFDVSLTCGSVPSLSPTLSRTPSPSPTPKVISCGDTVTGSTVGSHQTGVTYNIYLPFSSQVSLLTCGSELSTALVLRSADEIVSSCDTCANSQFCTGVPRANIIINTGGGFYSVTVGGRDNSVGSYKLMLTCNQIPEPSLFPSKSPSISVSASFVKTESRTRSNSVSPSISPSLSESASESLSGSVSISLSRTSSTSPSPSVSHSPSYSPSRATVPADQLQTVSVQMTLEGLSRSAARSSIVRRGILAAFRDTFDVQGTFYSGDYDVLDDKSDKQTQSVRISANLKFSEASVADSLDLVTQSIDGLADNINNQLQAERVALTNPVTVPEYTIGKQDTPSDSKKSKNNLPMIGAIIAIIVIVAAIVVLFVCIRRRRQSQSRVAVMRDKRRTVDSATDDGVQMSYNAKSLQYSEGRTDVNPNYMAQRQWQ